MWALGCILYEMACLQKAFEADNLPALVNKIMTVCIRIRGFQVVLKPSRPLKQAKILKIDSGTLLTAI